MHEVFVSYCTADKAATERLVRALEKRRLSCWVAWREIPGGENYQALIPAAIEAASVVLVLYSSRAQDSLQIPKEMSLATAFGKRLVGLRLENVKPAGAFAYEFVTSQYLDLFEDFEGGVDRLCCQLDAHCAKAGVVARRTVVAARWRRLRSWSLRTALVAGACAGAVLAWKLAPSLHGAPPGAEVAGAAPSARPGPSPQLGPTLAMAAVQAPAGPPANVPRGPEDAARQFATRYYSTISGPFSETLPFLNRAVTDPVQFYGRSISRSRLIDNQRLYAEHWPARSLVVRPGSMSAVCQDPRTCRVSGICDYAVHSDARQAASNGAEWFVVQIVANKLTSIASTPIDRHNFAQGNGQAAARPD